MKAWINDKLHTLALYWYITPPAIKCQLGRWFVWRDTPTWVITEVAGADLTESSPGAQRLIREAQRELQNRQMNEAKR